jgi:cyanate permease
MRKITTVIGVATALSLTATVAFAAEARTGQSGLAVWIFMAFCALIVVAQLLPALRARLLERRQSAKTEAGTVQAGGDR